MSSARAGHVLQHIRRLGASRPGAAPPDVQLLERFTSLSDQAAFAALVRRHGPMVLSVCRGVLHNEQDAEDAFQATFLVLARKAESIRQPEAVAGFLYEVAHRAAVKAQTAAARRRARERRAAPMTDPDPTLDMTVRDLQRVLHEELRRLPDKYQVPLVLCYLEGLSQADAAERLGWSKSTLRGRLDRGRERLRRRLASRGVALSALLCAAALTPSCAAAALVDSVVQGSAASLSPRVLALAEGVIQAMFTSKAPAVTVVLLAVALVAGAGALALAAREPPVDRPSPAAASAKPKPADEKADAIEVKGRVVDPAGKPVRGAKILFVDGWRTKGPSKVSATSGADGRFLFAVPRPQAANAAWQTSRRDLHVLAAAEGYGFAVARLADPEAAARLTLRLVEDDVPIRGRVLDLEGKPVAGVRVRINDLEPLNAPPMSVPSKGDLTAWLAALEAKKMDPWPAERAFFTGLSSPVLGLLFPSATTGADGRFQLRGVGRERLVHLRVEGPTIATEIVNVMTRPHDRIRLPLSRHHPNGEPITYHGATFDLLAPPTKPILGVVRDRSTGKPLAGVTVMPSKVSNPWGISNHNSGLIRATTDSKGRYRLVGLPRGDDHELLATSSGLPYLPANRAVASTAGLEPVTVDFALKRGVWVKGRVTEKTTGKPLSGGIAYYCLRDNPHHTDIPRAFDAALGGPVRDDGSFRFVAVPGRGVVAVQVSHNDRYLSGVGVEKIKVPRGRMGSLGYLDTSPSFCQFNNFNTLAEINPRPGDEAVTCDLTVVPGRSLTGTVLGPDGKPLAGARRVGWDTPLRGATFTVWGLNPDKPDRPRAIELVHEGKKLAGILIVRGDEKGPLRLQLQPWGVLTGRVLTSQGEPLTGVAVLCRAGDALTDKMGRFRIEGLTPGRRYRLSVSKEDRSLEIVGGKPKNVTLEAGETKDLGDMKVKEIE
jgi:RNA polymerase sigma factor (sigma-70 family)